MNIKSKTIWLRIRMWFLLALLFGIVYAFVAAISYYMGVANFVFYGGIAIFFIVVQYFAGPHIVGWSMRVKYVSEKEAPELHEMIEELAKKANIPKPKVGISPTHVPNAFAFGRWLKDGRVCVTQGILDTLSKDELKAVLGHEISHLKNRDVVVITMISIIPMIAWFIAWNTMWSRSSRGNTVIIGVLAFVIYFVTNLLVLYGSRIREYYADTGSVSLGSETHSLASALYKLVKGSANADPKALKQVAGSKAFFANDVSRARMEIKEIAQLDQDKSGFISKHELAAIRNAKLEFGWRHKFMEIMSTHPNMLKRIKALAEMR